MTIHKRLVLSNILMIVIPVVVALSIAAGGLGVVLQIIRSGGRIVGNDAQSVFWTSQVIAEIVELNLPEENSSEQERSAQLRVLLSSMNKMMQANDMRVVVEHNGIRMADCGVHGKDDESLIVIAREMNKHSAAAAVGTRNILLTLEPVSDGQWEIYVLGTQSGHIAGELMQTLLAFAALVVTGVVLSVIIMNRFLVRFVFERIEKPLAVLVNGVEMIGEGNLDHRIDYKMNDEFRPVCEAFNEMAGRLRQSVERTQQEEESRRMLIAGVSHDLRSPLTAVQAYTEGLLDGVAQTAEMKKHYLVKIRDRAEDMSYLINQLFLFSKLELNDYPINPKLVRLDQLIQNIGDSLRSDLAENAVRLEYKLEPVCVWVDPEQMRRVVSNILNNSVRYKQKQEGRCCIAVCRKENSAILLLEDDGPGVSGEALKHLFDVFYRTDSSRRDPSKGSGLGLAICKKLVMMSGGTITAENIDAGGLRIRIILPAVENTDEGE